MTLKSLNNTIIFLELFLLCFLAICIYCTKCLIIIYKTLWIKYCKIWYNTDITYLYMNGNFLSIAIISMNEHNKYYSNRSSNFNQWKTMMSVSFYHVNHTKNMTNKLLYFQYINNAIFHGVMKTVTLIIANTFVDLSYVSVDINISNIWAKIIKENS